MHVLLFQYEPFHEELGPGFVEAFRESASKITVVLNRRSLLSRGDVFSASTLPANANVIYHDGLQTGAQQADFQQLVAASKPDLAVLLTLQQPEDSQFVKIFANSCAKVLGVVHNVSRVARFPEVLENYTDNRVEPIFLNDHVGNSFLRRFSSGRSNWRTHIIYNVFQPVLEKQEVNVGSGICLAILGAPRYRKFGFDELLECVVARGDSMRGKAFVMIAGSGADRERLQTDVQSKGIDDLVRFSPLGKKGRCLYQDYYRCIAASNAVWCLEPRGLAARLADDKITSAVPSGLTFGKSFVCTAEFAERYGIRECAMCASDITSQLDLAIATAENNMRDFQALQEVSRLIAGRLVERNRFTVQNMLKH